MAENINAQIELSDGEFINFELYPDVAPLSVNNFIQLCDKNFYDGLCFHRVIPDFMIQGGGFVHEKKNLEAKGESAPIKGEFKSNGVANILAHTPGVFSMARTNVKDSATSQFFICVADCAFLNGEYAAFGKTTDEQSLNKAIAISKVKTTSVGYYTDVPQTPIVIKTIKIIK